MLISECLMDPSLIKMAYLKKISCILLLFILLALGGASERTSLLTTLEQSGYRQITGSSEITALLSMLSERYASAEKATIAFSALGHPVDALLVSSDRDWLKDGKGDDNKLTVMLVGSQHGKESSGAEALLLVARDILEGRLITNLEEMNFIFIPAANPDGRNLKRRGNGNSVNLNRNYMLLSEPESRGIINALHRWKPEVLQDVHESAALKKKSLGREGYLTVFEAQFEAANNPNIDWHIRNYSFKHLLPEILGKVNTGGLPARRYIKEIGSIHNPITHGGLSLDILRNMAGMLGAFSFLLETRLDPSTGAYPTPANILARVSKQYLSITTFLNTCLTHRSAIMAGSRAARLRWKQPKDEEPVYLSFRYVADPKKPEITLPLQRIDTGNVIKNTFQYRGSVESGTPLTLPTSYIINAHQDLIQDILARHHVKYTMVARPGGAVVSVKRIEDRKFKESKTVERWLNYSFKERKAKYLPQAGDLVIDLKQPARRLIPLLLEFRSVGSIFNVDDYAHLVEEQKDFFVLSTS